MPLTKIDAVALAGRGSLDNVLAPVRALYPTRSFGVQHLNRGWLGFAASADLLVDEAQVGRIGWGGKAQRGSVYLQLMGTGCALADDLPSLFADAERNDWPLRRADVALDVVDGSVTIQSARDAYERGGFRLNGRPPKSDMVGPADGSRRGRTLYIGDRTNDKMVRIYEKGAKELLSAIEEFGPAVARARMQVGDDLVDPLDWVRVELELKAKHRPIPYDICARRDEYFAGAYPYLGEILPNAAPQLILTPQRQASLALDLVLANIRRQYGTHLHTALMVKGGDILAVWDLIVGDKPNEAMLRAGVLLGEG